MKLEFDPPPIVGKFYKCKLRNTKIGELSSDYLCLFHEITKNYYHVSYQLIKDNKAASQMWTLSWNRDQVQLVSWELADVYMFYEV